jgi:tRNA dimethylallyltransferase
MNIDTPSPAPLAAPLALIAGPTASGKSALALALAERANGVVINADSAQVYRDLAILSARPSAADEARAPHRLYGTRDGAVPCSAADWAEDARHAVFEAHRAGKLPILVGGTGLYVRTLLEGIAPVPEIDPDVRAAVRAMPVSQSFEALRREDPVAAQRLRPSDTTRVARALEVVRSTGTPLADWHQHRSGGIAEQVLLRPLILLPPRDRLIRRCDDRFAAMMRDDGLEEVRHLLDRNLNPLLPVMRAIGVRELAAFLAGDATAEQALEQGQAATRQYAKRQYTWFSRQPPADWPRLHDPLDDEAAFGTALEMLTPA